jgi:dihydrofolate reductase
MSKIVAIMSMSLDGYVADLNDGVAEVFDWYFTSGDVEFHTGGADPMTFKVSGPSAEHLRGLWSGLAAVLTGRRTFDVAHGWGGNHAWGPAFVLTHHIPAGWPRPNSTVHFVTDGIESDSLLVRLEGESGDRAEPGSVRSSLADLAWLAGSWRLEGPGQVLEERWSRGHGAPPRTPVEVTNNG